jgi:hypothetical protein
MDAIAVMNIMMRILVDVSSDSGGVDTRAGPLGHGSP